MLNKENVNLTDEQRARIEANRLLAMEKMKVKRLKEIQSEKGGESVVLPLRLPELGKVSFTEKAPASDTLAKHELKTSIFQNKFSAGVSTSKKSTTSTKGEKEAAAVKKRDFSATIKTQLYSPSSFSVEGPISISKILSSIPGAQYNRESKHWIAPLSSYSSIIEMLSEKPFVEHQIPKNILQLFLNRNQQVANKKFNLQCIDSVLLESLYPFQLEGIEAALSRNGRVLLADDMGLGKSIQALAIARFYRLEWPLLIISPASMVASWYEQVLKWLPSIPKQSVNVIYDGKGKIDGLISILSYDLAVKLLPSNTSVNFGVIIADESHALKNKDSKRCKVLLPILKKTSRLILLSGTPALSRPLELYSQLSAINSKLFPKYFEFGRRYCDGKQSYFGWDFKGSSNLRELQIVLEQTVMIRRTKDSVLAQLPRKMRHQIFLRIDKKVLADFQKTAAAAKEVPSNLEDEKLEEFLKGAEYMALWRRTAEIKLPAIMEYVKDLLEGEHKMLIFAHHQSILDSIEEHLLEKKVRSIRIDGKTPTSQRQDLCTLFQSDITVRVALLSITAASTGLTLTAATTVIFAELFFNPGVLLQAEDRAHRIGQADTVNVHYLLAKGTTDDRIWPLILKKLNMLEAVGLGKNDFTTMSKQEHDPAQKRIDRFFKKRPPQLDISDFSDSDFQNT